MQHSLYKYEFWWNFNLEDDLEQKLYNYFVQILKL